MRQCAGEWSHLLSSQLCLEGRRGVNRRDESAGVEPLTIDVVHLTLFTVCMRKTVPGTWSHFIMYRVMAFSTLTPGFAILLPHVSRAPWTEYTGSHHHHQESHECSNQHTYHHGESRKQCEKLMSYILCPHPSTSSWSTWSFFVQQYLSFEVPQQNTLILSSLEGQ